MSIINEALKKTEEHLQMKTAQNNPLPPKSCNHKSYLLYILILLAGLFIGNLIFNLLKHTSKDNPRQKPSPVNNTLAVTPAAQPPLAPVLSNPPEETPLPVKTGFILNGIFFSDNDGYALINNQIVRVNDYVDGACVREITASNVQLDNAGQTITLTTPR